jgi:ParB-like chromosome segregation protein Spo0J
MDTEETKAHIAWLMESIKVDGVKRPIDVSYSDGEWYLEAGECRLRAAQALRKKGWDGYIPCFQVKGDEPTILGKSLLDNTGLPPTLLEVGIAVERLVGFGWTMERIATCIPPSLAADPAKALRVAKKALDLQQAPVAVKEAVKSGIGGVKVSEGRAVAEAKKNPLTAADRLATAASEARAKGQTTLKREKGAGKATKAKAAVDEKHRTLEVIGDAMADEIVSVPFDVEKLEKLANEWHKARRG